jgi:membrane protein
VTGVSLALPSSLTWRDLAVKTYHEVLDDDVLGLAAQLSYYFFLALFPAILFGLALASYFPLGTLTDDISAVLGPVVSPEVLTLIQEQMQRLANAQSGGLLTFGVLGALWSSSAAVVSIVDALNRTYDIEESRPWWKVRLTAIGLTLGLAVFILTALTLVLAGPTIATYLDDRLGFGGIFRWTWLVLQWPIALLLISTALGLVFYFGPDAEQDWVWLTPGSIFATTLWLLASLGFKYYVANLTNYAETYGALGGVMILMLWFYISGLVILMGAEMNAEIEHASPYGKDPGEKVPGERKKLGAAAARAYAERQHAPASTRVSRRPAPVTPSDQTAPGFAWYVAGIFVYAWARLRGQSQKT